MTKNLIEIRKEIDQLDQEMARLFEERLQLAKEVAIYKQEHNLPILDSSREKEVIAEHSKWLKNDDFLPYYQDFLQELMRISKEFQADFSAKNTQED